MQLQAIHHCTVDGRLGESRMAHVNWRLCDWSRFAVTSWEGLVTGLTHNIRHVAMEGLRSIGSIEPGHWIAQVMPDILHSIRHFYS